MARAESPVVEQIRRIIENEDDVLNGWGDEQIVAEAVRRAGDGTEAGAEKERWATVIAEIRSATDNDGQERRDTPVTA